MYINNKASMRLEKAVLINALLDRLLRHCSVVNINGPSYRLKDQLESLQVNVSN